MNSHSTGWKVGGPSDWLRRRIESPLWGGTLMDSEWVGGTEGLRRRRGVRSLQLLPGTFRGPLQGLPSWVSHAGSEIRSVPMVPPSVSLTEFFPCGFAYWPVEPCTLLAACLGLYGCEIQCPKKSPPNSIFLCIKMWFNLMICGQMAGRKERLRWLTLNLWLFSFHPICNPGRSLEDLRVTLYRVWAQVGPAWKICEDSLAGGLWVRGQREAWPFRSILRTGCI